MEARRLPDDTTGVAPPRPPRVQNGARDLEEFLVEVERRAFRLAELALGEREEALDAVQDAMMKFIGYRARPTEEWTPLFWSILRRRITDAHRRRIFKGRVFGWSARADADEDAPLPEWPDPAPGPAQRHAEALAWRQLGHAVRALPRRQREAFLLRALQGLDVADTAAAMGCSEGSVKTHLSRALDTLRTRLEDWR